MKCPNCGAEVQSCVWENGVPHCRYCEDTPALLKARVRELEQEVERLRELVKEAAWLLEAEDAAQDIEEVDVERYGRKQAFLRAERALQGGAS